MQKEIELVIKLSVEDVVDALNDANDSYDFHSNMLDLISLKIEEENHLFFNLVDKTLEDEARLDRLIKFCQTGR